MKWMQIRVVHESETPDLAQDLIAHLLMEAGAPGVEVTEPGETGLAPDISGYGPYGSREYSVTAHVPADSGLDAALDQLKARLEALEGSVLTRFFMVCEEKEDEPWETAWKAHFYPVEISPGLVVRPTWEPYTAKSGQVVIDMDPGMAFGTGAHPTTALCLEMLERLIRKRPPQRFLDVGTGSGILMIAAHKLGARAVFGCDNDPEAAPVARGNLLANQVPASAFGLWAGSFVSAAGAALFDAVAANITAEANAALIPDLPRIMAPGAFFVASGILSSKKQGVLEALTTRRFSITEVLEREGWAAVSARLS